MAKLSDESELYAELSRKFDSQGGNISLEFFNECIDFVSQASTREIKFLLFKLKCLYDDVDTGLEAVNTATKIIKVFVGDSIKESFMITVLEIALDEKQ